MQKSIKIFLMLLYCSWLSLTAKLVIAARPNYQNIKPFLNASAEKIGFEIKKPVPLESILSLLITSALSLMGVIFLIIILYGGYLWFTAGGNKQQLEKAQHLLRNAAIGLALVIGAYAIAYYVLYYFVQAVNLPALPASESTIRGPYHTPGTGPLIAP
jgi:hypothetical protein